MPEVASYIGVIPLNMGTSQKGCMGK